MASPYLGEIRMVSFGFPPKGWAACNGQLLPINQNQALFAILGTTYGGNGITSFALPNLQSQGAMHVGGGYPLGQAGGEATHALTAAEMPAHTHSALAAASATATSPSGAVWAAPGKMAFGTSVNASMSPNALGTAGQSAPHQNMPPYLALNFVIALQGIFPSRN
ncbi:MAG TPA: tail fiber protein [Microbacteriaceae bacterium]